MDREISVYMTMQEAINLQHILNSLAMANNENGNQRKFSEDMVRLSLKITHAMLESFVGGGDGQG